MPFNPSRPSSGFESSRYNFSSSSGGPDDEILSWLNAAGLNFDPFALLEASMDPRLSSYSIGHEAFSVAWGDWPAFLFAPPGGGKTALRARVFQACWVGQETKRPFSIPYSLPFTRWENATPSFEDHLAALLEAGGLYLLLTLTHRPHWFLRLSTLDRRRIRQALDLSLPGSLDNYLEPVQEKGDLQLLRQIFPPAFLPPDPPAPSTVTAFITDLVQTPTNLERVSTLAGSWEVLLSVLLDVLRLPSVYVLLDNLDGVIETSTDPQVGVTCLSPVMSVVEEWTKRGVYLKAFIPLDIREILTKRFPKFFYQFQSVSLTWSPALLAELVRRRIYVASQGSFGSLDPLTSPEIRDVETILAKAVLPLPREILLLTRQMIFFHVQNQKDSPKIQAEDVDIALQWYQENKPALRMTGE